MIKRVRDVKRSLKPQQKISFEDWQGIQDRALFAKRFFDEKNIAYMKLKLSLEDALAIVTENRVHEVREEHIITETYKKIFITPKKVQDDELVGQIKLIKDLFGELESYILFKEEVEQKEADGVIIIERNKEKHG